jgi:hypothetical protein
MHLAKPTRQKKSVGKGRFGECFVECQNEKIMKKIAKKKFTVEDPTGHAMTLQRSAYYWSGHTTTLHRSACVHVWPIHAGTTAAMITHILLAVGEPYRVDLLM